VRIGASEEESARYDASAPSGDSGDRGDSAGDPEGTIDSLNPSRQRSFHPGGMSQDRTGFVNGEKNGA